MSKVSFNGTLDKDHRNYRLQMAAVIGLFILLTVMVWTNIVYDMQESKQTWLSKERKQEQRYGEEAVKKAEADQEMMDKLLAETKVLNSKVEKLINAKPAP